MKTYLTQMFSSGRTLSAVKRRLNFGYLAFDCIFHVVENSKQILGMKIFKKAFLQHCIIDKTNAIICLPNGKTYDQLLNYCDELKTNNGVMIEPTGVGKCNPDKVRDETKAKIKERKESRKKV